MLDAFEWWTRVHRTTPIITLAIVKTLSDAQYVVGAEGWPLPSHFKRFYDDLWEAQRATDDVLHAYFPHDCERECCGEWNPSTTKHAVRPASSISH